MKVTLSFATPPGRLVAPIVTGLAVLLAGTLALAVWLIVSAVAARNELPALRARVAALGPQSAVRSSELAPLPGRERLLSLRERVARVNSLSGQGGQPILNLLAQLETVLPDNARIVSLRYTAEQGTTIVLAEADNDEALNRFFERLERSGRFAEVLLTRQSQRAGAGGAMRQFELRLKERA